MAWTPVSTKDPSVLQIRKLLSPIYLGLQLDSCTTYLNVEDFWVYNTTREGYILVW